LLDNLYYDGDPQLGALYRDMETILEENQIAALIVDNCPPYHPDYLRGLSVYKVLRIGDGPLSAYDRDIPYLHAYDHILYHSPAYSRDLSMAEKLQYCRAHRTDLWPMCAFEAMCDPTQTENTVMTRERDIDVIFVGALFVNKMPLLAAVKREFGSRFVLKGLCTIKRNAYFNAKYCFPGWVRPIQANHYADFYQRSKIGINVHNRGKYTVGNYRMFDLPSNGVMQISDGDEYLSAFFKEGEEIVGYHSESDLIDNIRYYLANPIERNRIALNGYRRVLKDYTLKTIMTRAGHLIESALAGGRI
jgi:spore maturation protein CgeB